MSKIAVLVGSPRKGGNTQLIADAFSQGIDRGKHSVDIICVSENKIGGCIGCNACIKDDSHRCFQKDGMQELYGRLAAADMIVIATPIYFYGVPSQLKCIIDRLHNPIRSTFRVKKLALLAVCADTTPTVFDSVKAMYFSVLRYFSLEDGGIVTASGVEKKGDIAGHRALEEARRLGESL